MEWGVRGGTESLKVDSHCQTTALTFLPYLPISFVFTAPYFLGSQSSDHRPQNHIHVYSQYKSDTHYFSKLSIHWVPCISRNRMENNHILQVTTIIRFTVWSWLPLFLAFKGVNTLTFWRSPPPLGEVVWQWVAIQYLSAPPPPPPEYSYLVLGTGPRMVYRSYRPTDC